MTDVPQAQHGQHEENADVHEQAADLSPVGIELEAGVVGDKEILAHAVGDTSLGRLRTTHKRTVKRWLVA